MSEPDPLPQTSSSSKPKDFQSTCMHPDVPTKILTHAEANWRYTIVGKCLTKRMYFPFFIDSLKQLWNPIKPERFIQLSHGFLAIVFASKDDMDLVLNGGPWVISKFVFFMQHGNLIFIQIPFVLHLQERSDFKVYPWNSLMKIHLSGSQHLWANSLKQMTILSRSRKHNLLGFVWKLI